jgi:hypothetical protein
MFCIFSQSNSFVYQQNNHLFLFDFFVYFDYGFIRDT